MLARLASALPHARLVTLVALSFAVLASAAQVSAQGAEAEWAFVPLGILSDERVQMSMRLQMDTDAAGGAAGVSLSYYGGSDLPPADDANLLLEAAGIVPRGESEAHGLEVARTCLAWAGDDELIPAAMTLGQELAHVWSDYGVDFPLCELTDDPALADILVFPAGEPPGEVDLRLSDPGRGFLVYDAATTPGSGGSGTDTTDTPGTNAGGPSPADTGGLGPSEGSRTVPLVLTLVAAAAVVFARWSSRPGRMGR